MPLPQGRHVYLESQCDSIFCMNTKRIGILIVVVLLAAGAWWYATQPSAYTFPLASGESVSSWSFQGAYTGNPEFEARAEAETDRLLGLFGQEGYTDYET